MKLMKKLMALFMAIVMIATSCSIASFAEKEEQIPSIIVPGIFQSEVFYYENGEIACDEDGDPLSKPFFMDSSDKIIKEAVPKALWPLIRLLLTQSDRKGKTADAVAETLCSILMKKQLCDENGKFINDIRVTKYNDSFADLNAHDKQYILENIPLQKYISKAGEENLYVFSYASLGNMIDTVNELYDFIQFVKEDSGSDKVNIVPISQGGSIIVGLMQLYADKNISFARDINRMVMVVPALNGSILVGEIYEYGLIDDDIELYKNMIPSLVGEDDWTSYLINVLLRIIPNYALNGILDAVGDTLAGDYLGYSTLIWGLVPSENYPGARAKYLTDKAHEKIVTQTDWFYSAQKNRYNNILNAIDDGVEVFDIVDYNYPLYELVDSWDGVNSDGIIHLDSESLGCYSAGTDKKLPSDYKSTVNNCTDPEHHDHTDPNGIVDVCCGLLPETTFFFYRQDHEDTGCNTLIMSLVAELLTDPDFTDVYSYPDLFPQFNVSGDIADLVNDINKMKSYDTSSFTAEQKAEFSAVIAEAEAAVNDTNMKSEDFEDVKEKFYDVTNKIINGDTTEEKKSFDSDALLLKVFKFFSDSLYKVLGGKGFSDIFRIF